MALMIERGIIYMKLIRKAQIEQELCNASRDFLKEAYNLDLTIPIKVNRRLITSLGRFRHYKSDHKKRPLSIELSGKLLEFGTTEQIISTLKHELIHYALYMLDRPYKDGQATFESELKKHDSCSTGTQAVSIKTYVYTCGCQEYSSYINRYSKGYRCSTCGNDITLSYVNEPQALRRII